MPTVTRGGAGLAAPNPVLLHDRHTIMEIGSPAVWKAG